MQAFGFKVSMNYTHSYTVPEFPVMKPKLVRGRYSIEYKELLQDADKNKDEFAILDGYVNADTEIAELQVPIRISSPTWCFIPVT